MADPQIDPECLLGTKLYGDDFTPDQIRTWYQDEAEGYANLGAKDAQSYRYVYHALNIRHGYRHLPSRQFQQALGLGSAYGDEFNPIIRRIQRITIVEPSDAFTSRTDIDGVPVQYVKPDVSGTLPFPDARFDLITCFGVLHHIPNVSHVIREMFRCLQPGGFALVREPIVSMGDWTGPRSGLTKHERGIPLPILQNMLRQTGFIVLAQTPCFFALTPRISRLLRIGCYNSPFMTRVDALISRLMAWNLRYHATNALQKLRPTSIFYVLRRPASELAQ
jgi:SAM-dependent methyltransferase